jgi:16S rRNA (guanine527-N7)-methyltransferase
MMDTLVTEAVRYGVRLDAEQSACFERYLALLQDWSTRVNLVGDADAAVVARRHFLESIALGAAMREREIMRPDSTVLDLGAGAGFPGLPMKIAWPSITLTMVDATAKKTAFLQAVVNELSLTGVRVLTGRAESLAHDPSLRETFDLVVARAVAPLPALLELALPFVRVGGRIVTPKGSRADEEVAQSRNALDVLGGRAFVVPFDVPGPEQRIVAIAKARLTPPEYPRRDGVPERSPL